MRTETEMHDLVVAKVAAHRRRRTLLASAGGGVAAVLLLVAVVAGASSGGPDDSVKAGQGDPTSTTEAPTTTEDPEPATSTSTTSSTSTTTTVAPTETTTAPEAPTTTAPPPPTTTAPEGTTTTTTSAAPGPTSADVVRTNGDLTVTFTVTTDPARPGVVSVRVRVDDPTGVAVYDDGSTDQPYVTVGAPGINGVTLNMPPDCDEDERQLDRIVPSTFDEVIDLQLAPGRHTLGMASATLMCHPGSTALTADHTVDVP